ncbi:MAG: hypothetical protein LUI87_07550 [Lachnospiraceae bacterium]|nr:hypothetical protein [Lachnospiraceae bacterium]
MKWDEKTYRKRIRQKKEQLSPKQIFLSGRYQGLLKKMAKEITDGSFTNVSIRSLGKTFPVGMFDGEQIVINLDHDLIQGYTKKDLMNLGIIGVLGHECGHKNYSDISLRHKYLLGIREEHKFYPYAPVPETEEDQASLASMKKCFENGDVVVISYVYEVAAFLQNLLEDRYIEYKMCRNYPGSIRKGILMNQVREFDSFPSVKSMQEKGQPKTYIMLNLISQYLFQKTVNAWNGIDDCYLECLNSCKPLIGGEVLKEGDSVRYLLTSRLLLKLWGFIQSDTDEIRKRLDEEEKQQETKQQEAEPQKEKSREPESQEAEQQEDNSQETESQEAKEQEDNSQETESQESRQQESGNESRSGMNDGADKPAAGGEKEDGKTHPVPCGQAGLSGTDKAAGNDAGIDAGNEKEASGGQEGNQDGINDLQNGNPQGNAELQTEILPGNTGPESAGGSGAGDDYREKAEKAARELGKCLPAYSQEPGQLLGGAHLDASDMDVKAGDMDWSGNWTGEDKADKGKTHPMRGEATEDSNAAVNSDAVEEKETQSSDGVAETIESTLQNPKPLQSGLFDEHAADIMDDLPSESCAAIPLSDAELLKIPFEVAKEQLDVEDEEQLHQKLGELLNQTDFGSCHENVPKQILREREVSSDAIRLYGELQKEVRKVRKKLEADLLPYLEKRHDREEKGLLIGRKMDLHALYRPDGKLFEKKQLPGQESDTVIALLIDLSGSMRIGGRIEQARFAALCLYEFCREADIPVAVYGHHTGLVVCNDSEMPRKEAVCLRSLAEFDPVDGMDAYRILDAEAKGSNRDGAAIRFMGEMLLKRPEKKKILALISDGLPNAHLYFGESARVDLMEAKEELTKKGITFLAAAIADDREAIQRIYGDAFVDISDVKKLPQKLMKQIIKRL